MIHRELEENFLRAPSKVDELLTLLGEIQMANKMEGNKEKEAKVDTNYSAGVTDNNFLVQARCLQVAKKYNRQPRKTSPANLNEMSFMRQIDASPEMRSTAREERFRVANNYRRLGNVEYRKAVYDKAIELYTKGLEYISDSSVLFVNRGLCYIKKREFKRGLIDLEYVIHNIDGRCLRAWLYKAGALKRMSDEAGFEECVEYARRLNRSEQNYIDYFIDKLRTDF